MLIDPFHEIDDSRFVVRDENFSVRAFQNIDRAAERFAIVDQPAGDKIFSAGQLSLSVEFIADNFVSRRDAPVPGTVIGNQEIILILCRPGGVFKKLESQRSGMGLDVDLCRFRCGAKFSFRAGRIEIRVVNLFAVAVRLAVVFPLAQNIDFIRRCIVA